MRKLTIILALAGIVTACHRPLHIVESKSEILMIDSTLDNMQDTNYLAHIAPIKEELEKE